MYRITGTKDGQPYTFTIRHGDLYSDPPDLAVDVQTFTPAALIATGPVPSPSRTPDPTNEDDLLAVLRLIPGITIDTITPPPAPPEQSPLESTETIY